MSHDSIVPSILAEVPPSKITITYPGDKSVDLGTDLTPSEVTNAPEIKWDSNSDKYYTLYMFDPDAPSQNYAFLGHVVHWLVINIKGCDLSTGEIISEYAGSGPPKGTGSHRYIFLVFEHDEPLVYEGGKITSRLQRMRFSTKKFREKYKLDKVHSWNYFKAQWHRQPSQESRTCVCM